MNKDKMELEKAINRLKRATGLGYENHEAIETVLQALEDRKKDIENYEKMYDEDEKEICKLHNKICDLEFELENKDKQIIALNEIIDEEM